MISPVKAFFKINGKVFGLLVAMLLGVLLPQLHVFSFLIRYLLMAMLFFAFLDIECRPRALQKSVLWIMTANVALAFVFYAGLAGFDLALALAAFMTAIAPTAIAAPVIIGFLRGEVEYVVAAVLVTNIASALVVPLALPFLLGTAVQISVWEVLQPVLVVMFVPLALAFALRRFLPGTGDALRRWKPVSFPIWLVNLLLICANASDFLRHENTDSAFMLIGIALLSLVICIVNFGLGALLGGHRHWQEASQSLGQKNLSFVIWIALTFINPLVAMGPTFYILYHHLYNSWSIYQFEKRRKHV
ncbi:MAG: hypothetical protein JXB85_15605 [Anaerolineales bacterium]|nr:hypothetical protein [Anaerolineales bacterium]